MKNTLKLLLFFLLFSGNQLFSVTVWELHQAAPQDLRSKLEAIHDDFMGGLRFIDPRDRVGQSWIEMNERTTLCKRLEFIVPLRTSRTKKFSTDQGEFDKFLSQEPRRGFLTQLLLGLLEKNILVFTNPEVDGLGEQQIPLASRRAVPLFAPIGYSDPLMSLLAALLGS